MSKVEREFSFGWATVKPPGEAVTYDTDLRFFRRDPETGREMSNEFIHGANFKEEAGKRTLTGDRQNIC